MNRKDKEMAYRKAAELIYTGQERFTGIALDRAKATDRKEFDSMLGDYFAFQTLSRSESPIGLRITILLSCAEITRLKFEIE